MSNNSGVTVLVISNQLCATCSSDLKSLAQLLPELYSTLSSITIAKSLGAYIQRVISWRALQVTILGGLYLEGFLLGGVFTWRGLFLEFYNIFQQGQEVN